MRNVTAVTPAPYLSTVSWPGSPRYQAGRARRARGAAPKDAGPQAGKALSRDEDVGSGVGWPARALSRWRRSVEVLRGLRGRALPGLGRADVPRRRRTLRVRRRGTRRWGSVRWGRGPAATA